MNRASRSLLTALGLTVGFTSSALAALFMTDTALEYLNNSNGWAVGPGAGVVVMDKGAAKSMTNTTLMQDVYAFPFGQRGFMAGLGLEGSKITRIRSGP